MDLTSKVVVVTGASRGIGMATARLLAARGAVVVSVGRERTELESLVADIGGSLVVADVADPAHAEAVVARAVEAHGRLDAVIANAGLGYAGPLATMPSARVVDLVDVNLRAPMLLARAAVPLLGGAGDPASGRTGALVFVSSIAGAVGVPSEAVYSATKTGLDTFATVLREELRDQRISVSLVVPGVVSTGFFAARGAPYDRRFPRPIPAERVAEAIVHAIDTGTARLVVPRWLAVPARLAAAAPRTYRTLARRFG